jgi:hypothetical protein
LPADQIEDALSGAGKVWYDKSCTPCHGPAARQAARVFSATKQPVDLRIYVKRHGGKFPASDWLAVIADNRPGSVHAPVWEAIKKGHAGMIEEEAASRGVVGSIARYVNSIQTRGSIGPSRDRSSRPARVIVP